MKRSPIFKPKGELKTMKAGLKSKGEIKGKNKGEIRKNSGETGANKVHAKQESGGGTKGEL